MVFTASFLAQVVQISAVPALIALRLQSAAVTPVVVGAVAAAPCIAILAAGGLVPTMLSRLGIIRSLGVALAVSLLAMYGMTVTVRPLALFGLNLLFGIALVIRWVAFDTWVLALAPDQRRGSVVGAHETLMGCGIATGPIVLAMAGFFKVNAIEVCMALVCLAACLLPRLTRSDAVPGKVRLPPATNGALIRGLSTALAGGAVAGALETSWVSFLPVMGERGEFALGSTAALFGFGLGGTVFQAPLGWLSDRVGFRALQLITAGAALGSAGGAVACRSAAPELAVLLFIWGGAAGGLNTLAVIEAGTTVRTGDTSRAMMAVAMAYTVGSILGPVATGIAEGALPGQGLSVAAGALTALFLILRLALR